MRRIAAIIIGLSLLSPSVWAQARRGMSPAVMKQTLREQVGLGDEQIAEIEQLRYEADRARLDLRHAIEKVRLDLEQAMQADRPDEKAVFALIDRLGELETRLKKNRIGLMLDIRKLLTPEQWQKMEALHARHKMRRRSRRMRRWRQDRPDPGAERPGRPGAPAPAARPAD
jgi:Spy/CpxP family protein refolding chaperone